MIGQTIADVAPETFFKEEEDQENHRGMLKLQAFEEKDLKRLGIKLIEGLSLIQILKRSYRTQYRKQDFRCVLLLNK